MGTDREQKWKKYFSSGSVDTEIKSRAGKKVPVYSIDGNVIDRLENGHPITVPPSDVYSKRYAIRYKKRNVEKVGYVSQSFVSKPKLKRGATENLGVRAETLIEYGELTSVDYNGKPIKVKKFTSDVILANSILTGLRNNKNVSQEIISVFEEYLSMKSKYDTIKWTSGVSMSEINELGKYVGELIIGLLVLKNNKKSFSRNFYKGKVDSFCVPIDPSFVGVDSFILMNDGEIIPISSKYGVGAKASVFANLLPKAMRYMDTMPDCVLKDFCKSAVSANVLPNTLEKKRGSKNVLYEYGINKILKLNISDPYGVYLDIKSKKSLDELSEDTLTVVTAIESYSNVENKVKEALPLSVTSFFSRETARQLNNDAKSIEVMKEILSGKNFWQGNLNIPKWKRGDVFLNVVNSGEAKIKIIGSKAAINDIEAKQGMLNYEIKLP